MQEAVSAQAVWGRPPPTHTPTRLVIYLVIISLAVRWHMPVSALPDGVADRVSVPGADAAEQSSHGGVFGNFPLVERREEDGRLVHVQHGDLQLRPVPELVQIQEASVHVVVDGVGRHDEAPLRFVVQRL